MSTPRLRNGAPFYTDDRVMCNHGHQPIFFYTGGCPLCKALADVAASDQQTSRALLRCDTLQGTVDRQSQTIDDLMS